MKRGFTLAEVLVVLAVIGILASLAIPTLLGKSDPKEGVQGVFETYSQQAQLNIQQIQKDQDNVKKIADINCNVVNPTEMQQSLCLEATRMKKEYGY